MLIFFFSPYVTRRTSYVALPSRVRLHEAKGAFFESHPVSRAPYAVVIGAPPRPVVFLSLSFSLPLVRSHARSLARSFGSRRPSACNFAPHLAAPIHRHQYFVIVRNGSGADRWLRCVSLSLSFFLLLLLPCSVSRASFSAFRRWRLHSRAPTTCSVCGRSSFPPRGPSLQLSRSHQPARSRCSAPFRPILHGSPTHERRNSLTQLDVPSVVAACAGTNFVCASCSRGEKRQFTRVSSLGCARAFRSALRLSSSRALTPFASGDISGGKETCGPARTTRKDSRLGTSLPFACVCVCVCVRAIALARARALAFPLARRFSPF